MIARGEAPGLEFIHPIIFARSAASEASIDFRLSNAIHFHVSSFKKIRRKAGVSHYLSDP